MGDHRATGIGEWAARFRSLDPDGRLVNVFSLDIVDGRIARLHAVLNPQKLRHLGEMSHLALRPGATI